MLISALHLAIDFLDHNATRNKFRLHSKDALCENLKSVIWVSRLNYVMIFSIDVSFEEKMKTLCVWLLVTPIKDQRVAQYD